MSNYLYSSQIDGLVFDKIEKKEITVLEAYEECFLNSDDGTRAELIYQFPDILATENNFKREIESNKFLIRGFNKQLLKYKI